MSDPTEEIETVVIDASPSEQPDEPDDLLGADHRPRATAERSLGDFGDV